MVNELIHVWDGSQGAPWFYYLKINREDVSKRYNLKFSIKLYSNMIINRTLKREMPEYWQIYKDYSRLWLCKLFFYSGFISRVCLGLGKLEVLEVGNGPNKSWLDNLIICISKITYRCAYEKGCKIWHVVAHKALLHCFIHPCQILHRNLPTITEVLSSSATTLLAIISILKYSAYFKTIAW